MDFVAFFDRTGTSNRPIEAINGSLEHMRDSAPPLTPKSR
jgi:hypothetical protein